MIENMEGLQRTNYCGDFTIDDVGEEVVVCGWVQRQRDLGHLILWIYVIGQELFS